MSHCIRKDALLTPEVLAILRKQHTEAPFTCDFKTNQVGTYVCRGCGLALFRANTLFKSGCGWPSYDQAIEDAVLERADADGRRTEIVCAQCGGHLGHVFVGEKLTEKNRRYCVNGLVVDFVADSSVKQVEEAVFAAGCFWGVETRFLELDGVVFTEVGYTGGKLSKPSYTEVCQGDTGHFEALRVLYDPSKLSYEIVIKHFFEIHNFEQRSGQGPDIGSQYKSAIFYLDESQKQTAQKIVDLLQQQDYQVVTQLLPATTFWRAEEYHQQYYVKNNKKPYCHSRTKRFE